jgi:hypothetical protein
MNDDSEFVWDIVDIKLPVYSATLGESTNDYDLSKVETVFTPKLEMDSDSEEPSMNIHAGTYYKKENSDYVIYVGNAPSEIIVNRK